MALPAAGLVHTAGPAIRTRIIVNCFRKIKLELLVTSSFLSICGLLEHGLRNQHDAPQMANRSIGMERHALLPSDAPAAEPTMAMDKGGYFKSQV